MSTFEKNAEHFRQWPAKARAAREAHGLSVSDLASRAGIDTSAVEGVESGANVTLLDLIKYVSGLDRELRVEVI